jgi:hypothetical protein
VATTDRYGRPVWYDPAYATLEKDDWTGRLEPRIREQFKEVRSLPEDSPDPGVLYRGMSAGEYREAKERGYIESKGAYNLGNEQVGRTYYSTSPRQAAAYAGGFAPFHMVPTAKEPGIVVGVKTSTPILTPIEGEGATERGLGRVPFKDVTVVYEGRPYIMEAGFVDLMPTGRANPTHTEGSRKSPSSGLVWSKIDYSKVLKYSPDQPRDDIGRWTSTGGGAGEAGATIPAGAYWQPPDSAGNYKRPEVFRTNDIDQAILALRAGAVVELQETRQAYTLLSKLGEQARAAEAAGKKAEPINLCNVSIKGTNLFCAERQLSSQYPRGVPRVEMPQLNAVPEQGSVAQTFPRSPTNPKKVDGAEPFVAHLRTLGIGLLKDREAVPSAKLKASQAEMNAVQVGQLMQRPELIERDQKPIFISRDNYILDGHHRWAASVGLDAKDGRLGDSTIVVRQLDAPITELLHLANDWTAQVGLRRQRHGERGYQKYAPDQPRDEAGRWTDTGDAGESGGLAGLLHDVAQPDGGFTYSPLSQTKPITGYALSVYKGREQALPLSEVTPQALARYTKANWDLLSQENNYLGAWHNPENHQVYLDISTVVKSPEEAERLGRQHQQLAYFDLQKGQSVSLTRGYHDHTFAPPDWLQGLTAYLGRSLGLISPTDGQRADTRRDRSHQADSSDLLKFNQDQPRVPAGSPEGGQWTSGDGGGVPMTYTPVNPHGVDSRAQYTNPDGSYSEERLKLHDEIIRKAFEGKTPVERPRAFMMGGGPAAGKTSILKAGVILDLPENRIDINADDVKELLPEFHTHGDEGAAFVHEESSDISKKIATRAGRDGYNVMFDGAGDSSIDNLKAKVDKLRANGQQTIANYATVPIPVAIERAFQRGQDMIAAGKTGRFVPTRAIIETHKAISAIFPKIVSEGVYDHVTLWDTTEFGKPVKIAQGRGRTLTVHDQARYDAFLAKATYQEKGSHATHQQGARTDHRRHAQHARDTDQRGGTGVLHRRETGSAGDEGQGDGGGDPEGVGDLDHWTKAPTPTEIEKLPEVVMAADRLDPYLRRRFIEAIKLAQNRINLNDLQLALRAGNLQRILETLHLIELEGDLRAGTSEVIQRGYLAGAKIGADKLVRSGVSVRFDLINPHAVQWSEKRSGTLVKEITEKQHDTVKTLVSDSLRTGRTVQEVARSLRDVIGLHPRQERAVRNLRTRLEGQGLPSHTISDRLTRYAGQLLRQRADMIARTELNRAAQFGQKEQWDLAASLGLFDQKTAKKEWQTTVDDLACEICLDMDGTVIGYQERWELPDDRKIVVPTEVHPHCRCSESLVF